MKYSEQDLYSFENVKIKNRGYAFLNQSDKDESKRAQHGRSHFFQITRKIDHILGLTHFQITKILNMEFS